MSSQTPRRTTSTPEGDNAQKIEADDNDEHKEKDDQGENIDDDDGYDDVDDDNHDNDDDVFDDDDDDDDGNVYESNQDDELNEVTKEVDEDIGTDKKAVAAVVDFYPTVSRSIDTRADSMLYHMRKFNNWLKAIQIQDVISSFSQQNTQENPSSESPSPPQQQEQYQEPYQRGGRGRGRGRGGREMGRGRGRGRGWRRGGRDGSRGRGGRGEHGGGRAEARGGGGRGRGGGKLINVLDLACGKGGDLGKWTQQPGRIKRYVGVDIVLPSLVEAAERAENMRGIHSKLQSCSFVCADLGSDVLGETELKAWSLPFSNRDKQERQQTDTPDFKPMKGGGVGTTERFDVISIQFAIHYMFSDEGRARRFFQTVSDRLVVGGVLIGTTVDSRVVLAHLMDMGIDHRLNDGETDAILDLDGTGTCKLTFQGNILKKIFNDTLQESRLFGLEYLFELIEGSDQDAGAGHAVNAPEYLLPLPTLQSLAAEFGLEMESFENFHEFYGARCFQGTTTPRRVPAMLLKKMGVLNYAGSISKEEWDICRLYCAFRFRKVVKT